MFLKELQQLGIFELFIIVRMKITIQLFSAFCVNEIKKT